MEYKITFEGTEYDVLFQTGQHGYTSYIKEHQGIISQGLTKDEAFSNLKDAVMIYQTEFS